MKIGDSIKFNGDADKTGYFLIRDPETNISRQLSYKEFIMSMPWYNPRWLCFRYIMNQTDLLLYKSFISDMTLRYAKEIGLNVNRSYDVHITDHEHFTNFIIDECCRIKKG